MNLELPVAKGNDYTKLSTVGATAQAGLAFQLFGLKGVHGDLRASNRIEAIAKIAQARYNVAAS